MLKTNSKQVKRKIREYLYNTFTDYEGEPAGDRTESQVLDYIAEKIAYEKLSFKKEKRAERFIYLYKGSILKLITDYTSGLGSLFDCDYYLNKAVNVLGDILEQTQEERSKYSQSEAEELMTLLISRELKTYILMAIY